MSTTISTQNGLLFTNLINFYSHKPHIDKMLGIINGDTNISLRIVDWFVTNYSKKHYTVYDILNPVNNENMRFKVFGDYKLKLKAYKKKRFDPFCRWDRIVLPYVDGEGIQTTIGQLNFFKWAIENKVIDYIENHYADIEADMVSRNSLSKKNDNKRGAVKTRKKREELSILASKSIKKEDVEIVVKFA